jgi:hypothetical protein
VDSDIVHLRVVIVDLLLLRGLAVGKTKRGKGTKIMAIADASGFPVAACIESTSPHEVRIVEKTIDSSFTPMRLKKSLATRLMTVILLIKN